MREKIERLHSQLLRKSIMAKAAILAASALTFGTRTSEANTIQWVASQGDITQSSNWAGNVLPGVNDIGAINNAGEAQISGNEGLTLGELRVGDQGGSNYGVLMQTGGTITDTAWLAVGRQATGLYQMSGGSLIKTGGGMFLILGGNSSQVGVMQLSGTASVALTNSGNFALGDAEFFGQSNAQLYVQDSASVNLGGAELWIGNQVNATGYLGMSGGSVTDSNWMSVGRNGGQATVDLSGGTISKTGDNGSHFIVGDSNSGSNLGTGLINQSGGALISANSDFWLGSNGIGTYNITGGTLTTLALDIGINSGSTGTLNLNGGAVSAAVVVHGSGTAAINFNGGILQPRQSNASFLQNFTSTQLNVQAGGAIFDTGGYDNTISTGLSGVGGLTLQGSGGSLTLSASNTYAGPTTVNGGTLIIAAGGTLGAGVNVNLNGGSLAISSDAVLAGKTLAFNGGALQFQNYNSSSISFANLPNLMLGAATGAASAFEGQITGSGSLTYVGPGTLNLTNTSNSYSGGTFINNGVLQAVSGSLGSGAVIVSGTGLLGISSDASIPGSLVLNGGGVSFNNYSSALNFNPGLNLTLGAAVGTASTLTGRITDGPSSATSLTYVGPGTLNLRGSNTYTGGTNIAGGVLNVTANSTGSGAILLNGGTLQYASGNTADLTASPYLLSIGALGGEIDTNGNNISFAGNILPASTLGSAIPGFFQKTGAGTLTLNGTLSATGFLLHQGGVTLAGSALISTATTPVSGADDYSSIGHLPGDVATLTLRGSSTYIAAGDFNVGDNNGSSGTLIIADSASLQVRSFYVGKFGSAIGVVNQTGGSVIEADNGAGPADWRIGGIGSTADSTAVGVYNLSGGSFNTGGGANLQIGAYGQGTFIQAGGTVNVGGFLSIGRYSTGVGMYNMSGGVLTATIQPVSVVGEQGNGTLLLSGSATYNTQKLLISQDDGSTGVVQQTGGLLIAPNGVAFGQNETGNTASPSTGTYNLSGGTLQTSGFTQFGIANETGTVNFNGGTLQATQSGVSLLSGVSHAYVQAGGLVLNASIGSVSISQSLQHDPTAGAPARDGGLTLLAGQLTLNASDSYTGATSILSGILISGTAGALPAGSVVNVGRGATLVSDSQATVSNLALLNVNGNVIVHNGNLATLSTAASGGFTSGWNSSTGIASSSAAGDSNHLTAVGIIQNDDGTGKAATLYSTFGGQPVADSDVLLKYTYYGDTNLDGTVDGSDYSRIDTAFVADKAAAGAKTGWFNGDFNYDGVIDGSDYTLIDNAFNQQGAALAASIASPTAQIAAAGSNAVPEPSTLGLMTIAAAGVLRRRRRDDR
jgi:autotransporter-associated beta strand protein